MKFIQCPICSSSIILKSDKAVCEANSHEFRIDNGVILFEEPQDYYWGGWLGPAEMSVLLRETSRVGWKRAIKLFANTRLSVIQNIIDERRAAWKFFFPFSNFERALDYGCGMGSITLSLARSFNQVIACDLTKERCIFTVLRGRQEGFNNILGVVGFKNSKKLPFISESFDFIVLYGTLEWLAESTSGDPMGIQLGFLSECYRLLKKSGCLCVGIENATALKYLRGERDDHAHELRFTTFLPRRLSNWISLHIRGQPYRTYIYSFKGYYRLFKRVGFKIEKVYYPYPDYRSFAKLVNLNSSAAMANFIESFSGLKREVAKALERVHLLKRLVSSYLWILKK